MFGRKKAISIESFFVIILMIMFTTAISVVIIQGSNTFDNIITQKNNDENLRIAMSYINTIIKQNDHIGAVELSKDILDNTSVLVINHDEDESDYVTYIYYKAGKLYECYTDKNTAPTDEISTAIIDIDDVKFDYNNESNIIEITYLYNRQVGKPNLSITQVISLNSR